MPSCKEEIPREAYTLFWEAMHHAGKGDNELALQYLSRAVAIAPAFTQAYKEMGNCNLRLGRFWEAVSSYDKVLSIVSGNPGCTGNLQACDGNEGDGGKEGSPDAYRPP
jgi:Flp pilus assembly protein TadD